ncbi:hypothetical protein PV328_004124 [Microctonus aethiopoides]|uniref:Uncharacterized protein n=1 Tax=Microctonus aethiopoides TaxID=144406 RepID=A0AA39F9U5_9HYME|nr:hypothetical protein PV328_004124 [Microctonus aethiopoides]
MCVLEGLDQVAPLRERHVSKHHVPWLNDDHKQAIKCRDRLFKRAKGSRSLLDYEIYKQSRNEILTKL